MARGAFTHQMSIRLARFQPPAENLSPVPAVPAKPPKLYRPHGTRNLPSGGFGFRAELSFVNASTIANLDDTERA
jgi:hypothetical protein